MTNARAQRTPSAVKSATMLNPSWAQGLRTRVGLTVAGLLIAGTAWANKPYVAPTEPPKPPAPSDKDASDACPEGTQLHKTRTEKYCYKPNYNKEGLWLHWYDGGQKKAEITMKDGKREGRRTLWHENGQKKEEGDWQGDKEVGRHTEWAKDGKKAKEREYKQGVLEGHAVDYFPSGKPKEEIDYKNGKTDGKHIWYFDSGNKQLEGTFTNGRKHGLQLEWNSSGALVQAICYKDTAESWRAQDEAEARSKKCP